jgi:tetratricopeptide (TPR) repeat protein
MSTPSKLLLAIVLPAAALFWVVNRPGVSAEDGQDGNDGSQVAAQSQAAANDGASSSGSRAGTSASGAGGDAGTARKPHADMDAGSADPHESLTPELQYDIALRHANEGKHDAAINHLNQAIAQDSSNAIFFATRSQSYAAMEDLSAALRDIETAAQLAAEQPDTLKGVLTNRSQLYRQFNRDDEALADLDKALELDKNYVPALFNRSHILINQNQTERAVEDLTRAILLQPELAAPYFNRAMAYETLENMEKARADMTQFLELARGENDQNLAHGIFKQWNEAGK